MFTVRAAAGEASLNYLMKCGLFRNLVTLRDHHLTRCLPTQGYYSWQWTDRPRADGNRVTIGIWLNRYNKPGLGHLGLDPVCTTLYSRQLCAVTGERCVRGRA